MAKVSFKSVDAYIAKQPQAARPKLLRVRTAIRKALPGAEESVSYQIPTYKLQGRAVIYFAGWKEHYSLYPVNDRVVKEFKAELMKYELSRSTLRLPLTEPVPVKLIAGIAKLRAKEVSEVPKAKATQRKKR